MFCHLVKHSKESSVLAQGVLYFLDLVTYFPPAVRTMHTLLEGNTPASSDCAALSHALFCILTNMVPARLIAEDQGRYFEGARLLFGLLFSKAKNFYSAEMDNVSMPHRYFQVSIGQPVDENVDDSTLRRAILLNGQKTATLAVTCATYQSPQSSRPLDEVVLLAEFSDLQHLAAICGNLAVSRPSDLASVAAPCLTFDSMGHLAIYTGRVACAVPGEDMTVFQPHHGEGAPDMALVEQAIAPILARYKAEGTDVFAVVGTPQTRRLQSPDEILMFVVDCSQSMQGSTEFLSVEEGIPSLDGEISRSIDVSAYARASLDGVKASIMSHEVFEDVIASVAEASAYDRRPVATRMLQVMSLLTCEELNSARKAMRPSQRRRCDYDHGNELSSEVENLQTFVAGLRTHESALVDFLIFRASSQHSIEPWKWSIADPISRRGRTEVMPPLPGDLTEIPVDIRCPISYEVLQDPVIAADTHTYSLQAITKWFRIRRSSPLTGLLLSSTELAPDHVRADQASSWILGEDLLDAPGTRPDGTIASPPFKRRRTSTSDVINITMSSQADTFTRVVPVSMCLADLYALAFRGMRGRHTLFQLYLHEIALGASCERISTRGIPQGATVQIRVPNIGNLPDISGRNVHDDRLCLVKVYRSYENMDFAYWTQKTTDCTLATIIVKYWRHLLQTKPYAKFGELRVWAGMVQCGDGWCNGGTVGKSDQHLRDFLTAQYAFGTLKNEPVYKLKQEV